MSPLLEWHRCSSLQKLALPFCGIGLQGAASLAAAITPTQPPPGKPVVQPKLTALDLQVPYSCCVPPATEVHAVPGLRRAQELTSSKCNSTEAVRSCMIAHAGLRTMSKQSQVVRVILHVSWTELHAKHMLQLAATFWTKLLLMLLCAWLYELLYCIAVRYRLCGWEG